MCIKSDANNGQQYQNWLFALSEILSKIGIGFISNFLFKARVSYLTILKRKSLSLPLKVETGQFVISLVLPECLSVKICCISPSDSEANRNGDGRSPLPLFFPFSTSFKNECQTTRPKIGGESSRDWGRIVQIPLRTLAQEETSENCLCFGTGGPSLCLYWLMSRI